MAYIHAPERWKRKPQQPVAIDWGHPLSRSLAFCALFNERGGLPRDLVRLQSGALNGSASWRPEGGKIASASSDYFSWTNAQIPDSPFTANITLLWRGTIDTGASYRHFAGKHTGNGATNAPFDYRTDNAATPLLQLVRSDATTDSAPGAGPAVTLGVEKLYAASNAAGVAGNTYYVDRTKQTGTAAALTPTGGSGPLNVGERADGTTVQMDGRCVHLYIYSRVLGDGEIAALADAPYQFLRPMQRRIYVNTVAAAGGTTYPQLERGIRGLNRGVALGSFH